MRKHIKTAKVNIPICIASFLFCLTVISIHLTGGLYAKYVSTGSAGDAARVISFGDLTLTESGNFNEEGKLMIIPGVSLQKKAVVDFAGSEAATYVFIEVVLSSTWQTSDSITFAISSGSKTLMQWKIADGWDILKSDNGTCIYYRELAPNTALNADIIADNGSVSVSEYITQNEISSMTGIFIKLRASAVQSGGFDSPAAAWESIAEKEW